MNPLIRRYYTWRVRRAHKKCLAAVYRDDDKTQIKYATQLLQFKRRELGIGSKR